MKKSRIERLHMAVMAACLVCCVTLLLSVAFDRPLTHPAAAHVPVLRTAPETGIWPGEHDLAEEEDPESAEAGAAEDAEDAAAETAK
ncbi:MAG: hypothetical protein IJT76_02285 [Clostridia bacterium]|nr:hypothetical protein [Clostridia bacterium]